VNTGKTDLEALKRRVGRRPFEDRLNLTGDNAPCPVHKSKDGTPVSLWKGDGGIWFATCHSKCDTTWDAIGFVEAVDEVDFKEAVARLGGKLAPTRRVEVEDATDETTPQPTLALEAWAKWGRELTEADVTRFEKSRPDSRTPGFAILKKLGCRVQGDYIGFPYRYGEKIYGVKLRHMDEKRFQWAHKPKGADAGMFNLETVDTAHWMGEGCAVVESELDAALMEELGFPAASVPNSNAKFSDEVIEILTRASPIFLIGDQDTPGQACMDALQEHLPAKQAHRIYFDGAKDVGELANQLGEGFAAHIATLQKEAPHSTWGKRNIPLIQTLTSNEPKWVIDRLLPFGGLSILCSKQGGNKSLLALLAAKAITGAIQSPDDEHSTLAFDVSADFAADNHKRIPFDGTTFLGRAVPRPYPVYYIDRENGESEVTRRRLRIGLLARDNLRYWGDWNDWTDPRKATPDAPDDPRLLEIAAKEKAFFVFDSLQDWYGEISEIDNSEVVALMNKFKRLARVGAGVLVLHHDAKFGDTGYRGATGFVGVPDMSIGLEKNGDISTLRAIRFRQCANWLMDFKIHYTPHEDKVRTWSVEVLLDQTESDAIAAAKKEKAEKASKAEADALAVAELIEKDPYISQGDLARAMKTSEKRVKRLAGLEGWAPVRQDNGGWMWVKGKPEKDAPGAGVLRPGFSDPGGAGDV